MGKQLGFMRELVKNRALFIMSLPAVFLVILFAYLPMSGLVLAFKNYRFDLGIFGSEWIGFENFKFFFISGNGWAVTRNTVFYNLANLVTSQGLAVIIAIVVSEMTGRIYKRVMQSVIILPYFISWIIVGAFVYNIFNFDTGAFNTARRFFGLEPINLYQTPNAWIWIIMIFNSWKWAGYNSIIYIAAIMGVDVECYESADIDGANIWQKINHITIPSIRPTIIVMLLLNIGRVLRGDFQMFYQIVGNNGQLFSATDVIDTFVFRSLLNSGDMGMSAAITLYQSVFCFIIIITVNAAVKKIDADYALF